jgi:hypothetical protein
VLKAPLNFLLFSLFLSSKSKLLIGSVFFLTTFLF